MRKGWREVVIGLGLPLLLGIFAPAASSDRTADAPVRLTMEIVWTIPPPTAEGTSVDLSASEGRVLEAVGWPAGSGANPEPRPEGGWRLGSESAGRARIRVEAPLGASLVFRTGGQSVKIPILAVLDGPQRTPPRAPVEIGVERLAWDSLTVRLARGDGIVAPGSKVAVLVGHNVLLPEPGEFNLRATAELRPSRGGEPVWRDERQETATSNQLDPPARPWNVVSPQAEGTYVLEVRSTWEPVAGREGSRIARLIRRRRAAAPANSATRRVTLAVVGAKPPPDPASLSARPEPDVDTLDLARMRGRRLVASGRSPASALGRVSWSVPESALVEPTGRDRLMGWITRVGPEASKLAAADGSGLAWSAVGLKVAHPGRPHRLTLKVTEGLPATLGVALVDLNGPGGRPRLALDACASGLPILKDGPASMSSWLVWPDTAEPVLVLVNRGSSAPLQLGTVVLTELADLPAGPAIDDPGSDRRTLALHLAGPNALDQFGGGGEGGDTLGLARRLTRYLNHVGATAVVLPEALADRSRRRALDGQAAEDSVGPDRLDLLLRLIGRQGRTAWLELALDGPLPGLPASDSPEALARGLVRVDRHGLADGPVYHPLHPDVREALKRRVAQALASRKDETGLNGVLVRLGPGPTLLGGPDTGLDDRTYARFVRETFDPETAKTVAGAGTDDPRRFDARAEFLAGSGRMPWLTWRARGIAALYADLAEAARQAAPGVTLAVATPGLDDGPAGAEARRVDLTGMAPSHAWRAVGLDLDVWPTSEHAPIVLRGVSLSPDDLAQDLATSPELDAKVASRPARGMLLAGEEDALLQAPSRRKAESGSVKSRAAAGLRLTAAPLAEGVAGDEPLGHAVAALDARWVVLSATAVAGREEQVRKFAVVFRSLPAPPTGPPSERRPFGVAVRALPMGEKTYLSLANDTPYSILLETIIAAPESAEVDDLGRRLRLTPKSNAEGRQIVLELPPYGVQTIRVGAPGVKVGTVTPYPSDAVATSMRAQYDELSNQLAKLKQAGKGSRPAPPNPGFEPSPPSGAPTLAMNQANDSPVGWKLTGGAKNSVVIDLAEAHAGAGSLKLSALEPPASVVSEGFAPDVRASMTVQAWFRSARPDAKLRLWIEGEAAGRPYVRRSDLTVQPDWQALAVRASDVPPGGLDVVRLRFEMLTAGTLWLDDLTVTGESLTESERHNALRALVAAMHAYREKRYADFARLSGSRWAKRTGVLADLPGARPGVIRTGEANALPPDRRLR